MVPLLLRARLRMAINGALSSAERRGWTAAVSVMVAGAMLLGGRATASALAATGAPSPSSVEPALAAGLGRLAGFVAVTSVTFALASLYFARDIDLLLSAPLPPRAIVLSRMAAHLATGAAIGALIAAPPVLAYLGAVHALAAAPLVAVDAIAFCVIPLSLGTGLVIVAVRLMPARRIRDAAGVIAMLLFFGIIAGTLALRGAEGFTSGVPAGVDIGGTVHTSLDNAWLPTGWAARSAVEAASGNAVPALGWAVPLLLMAALLPLAVARVGEGAWVGGYQASVSAGSRRRRRVRSTQARGRPRPWAAIARKDLIEIRRDGSQLAQLLLPMALFALYIAAPQRATAGAAHSRLPGWFLVALTAAFAGLFSASGIALRGIGTEGTRLWVLRVAPIRTRSVLTAKFASGMVVASILSTLLLWLGGLRAQLTPIDLVTPTLLTLVVTAGLVGVATGLGAVRPKLSWTDPRRAVGLGLSLSFLALGATYLALCFVLLGLPYAVERHPAPAALAVSAVATAALAAAAAGVALRLGAGRLAAMDI